MPSCCCHPSWDHCNAKELENDRTDRHLMYSCLTVHRKVFSYPSFVIFVTFKIWENLKIFPYGSCLFSSWDNAVIISFFSFLRTYSSLKRKGERVFGLNSAIRDKHAYNNNTYLVRVLCQFLISKCVVEATSMQLFLFVICLIYTAHHLRSEFRILVAQLGFNVTL